MLENQKLAYSPEEVAKLLGLHLNTVRKHIKQGLLPARKLGHRVLIPAHALRAWLEGKENPAGRGGER